MDYFNQTLAKVSKCALCYNQADHQVSTLVICHPISSEFHIWTTFIELLVMSDYGFCPMNSNQNCRQTAEYPLFTAGHYVDPLSESDCSSLFLNPFYT